MTHQQGFGGSKLSLLVLRGNWEHSIGWPLKVTKPALSYCHETDLAKTAPNGCFDSQNSCLGIYFPNLLKWKLIFEVSPLEKKHRYSIIWYLIFIQETHWSSKSFLKLVLAKLGKWLCDAKPFQELLVAFEQCAPSRVPRDEIEAGDGWCTPNHGS